MKTSVLRWCSVVVFLLLVIGCKVSGKPVIATVNDPALAWRPCPEAAPEDGCEGLLLQGDPTTGPVTWLTRLPQSSVVPNHWHASDETLIVFNSKSTLFLEGEEPRTLDPSTYVYIPAGLIHGQRCEGPCVIFIYLDGPLDFNFAPQ